MKPSHLAILVALTTAATPSISRADKIEPREVPALLDQLLELESKVGLAGSQRKSSALEAFRAASVSERAALDFYLKCSKELYFTRDEAKESEWRTWRDRNESRLKDKAFALALQLQLKYLVLTVEVLDAEDIGTMIPEISRFLETVSDSLESLEDRVRMLREPVTNSVFAQVYLLDRSLDLGEWAPSPLDLPGIFDKTIIPYLIEKRPDQVGAAWDARIRFQQKMVEIKESPALTHEFESEILPDLRWQKAQDEFAAGLETTAVQSMLSIARTHTTHPSAPEWLLELRKNLEAAVYPTPADQAPAATTPTTPPAAPPDPVSIAGS